MSRAGSDQSLVAQSCRSSLPSAVLCRAMACSCPTTRPTQAITQASRPIALSFMSLPPALEAVAVPADARDASAPDRHPADGTDVHPTVDGQGRSRAVACDGELEGHARALRRCA